METDRRKHDYIKTVDKPEKVVLWQANNPEGRDFRIESVGPIYTSQELKTKAMAFTSPRSIQPEKGWTAFFAELTYDVGMPVPLKVTTNVGITPDTFPFADKNPALPTSLTLEIRRPQSRTSSRQIKDALRSPEFKTIGEDPRLKVDDKDADKGIAVTLNWVPKGEFDDGARAIADRLENWAAKTSSTNSNPAARSANRSDATLIAVFCGRRHNGTPGRPSTAGGQSCDLPKWRPFARICQRRSSYHISPGRNRPNTSANASMASPIVTRARAAINSGGNDVSIGGGNAANFIQSTAHVRAAAALFQPSSAVDLLRLHGWINL